MSFKLNGMAALCACGIFCAGFASCKDAALPLATVTLEFTARSGSAAGGTVSLVTEIARTEKEQEKGYMERKDIPDGTGMIFMYTVDNQLHFWMKNTPHPLSIAFIDSAGIIREIYDMKPYSLETVSSERSVRYALEVPQGWFTRAGLAVGDRLAEKSLVSLSH